MRVRFASSLYYACERISRRERPVAITSSTRTSRRPSDSMSPRRRLFVQLQASRRKDGVTAPKLIFVVAHRRVPRVHELTFDRGVRSIHMAQLPLTGGCLCGAVRYEVTEPLVSASYCHCTRCQRRTGTAASAQATGRAGRAAHHPGRGARARVRAGGRVAEVLLQRLRRRALEPPSDRGAAQRPARHASTTIPASSRSGVSSSPTQHRGRRYRTTGCRATRKGRRTDGQVAAQGQARAEDACRPA